jgi:hypothetical protein
MLQGQAGTAAHLGKRGLLLPTPPSGADAALPAGQRRTIPLSWSSWPPQGTELPEYV